MVAAPFKMSLIAALGSPQGPRKIFTLAGDDVANNFLTFDSGSSDVVLSGASDVYIVDTIYSAGGTDTTNDAIYLAGTTDGTKIFRSTSLATTVLRPMQSSPFRVPKGTSIKFKELA